MIRRLEGVIVCSVESFDIDKRTNERCLGQAPFVSPGPTSDDQSSRHIYQPELP